MNLKTAASPWGAHAWLVKLNEIRFKERYGIICRLGLCLYISVWVYRYILHRALLILISLRTWCLVGLLRDQLLTLRKASEPSWTQPTKSYYPGVQGATADFWVLFFYLGWIEFLAPYSLWTANSAFWITAEILDPSPSVFECKPLNRYGHTTRVGVLISFWFLGLYFGPASVGYPASGCRFWIGLRFLL